MSISVQCFEPIAWTSLLLYSSVSKIVTSVVIIDVKNVFYVSYYFYKKRVFNVFYFLNVFYFAVDNFVILLNQLNSYMKRLLNEGFNIGAIGNSIAEVVKTLSCTL